MSTSRADGPRLPTAGLVCLALTLLIASGLAVPAGASGSVSPASTPRDSGAPVLGGQYGTPVSPPAVGVAGPTSLPGSDPSGEPFFDAGAIASRGAWAGAPPPTTSLPPSTARSASRWGAAPALPVPPYAVNGTVSGRVKDSMTNLGIPGASVTLTSVSGGCPASICPSGTTDAAGTFVISAAAGVYTVSVSATNYSDNETTVTVQPGFQVSVGTMYLVRDGFITGILEGSDPTHEPLWGFGVSSTSRNGVLAGGLTATAPDGSFLANVPPVADRVDFLPPPGQPYDANHTFVDPAPGKTTDLGVIYLVRATELNLSLVDRVTHQPLGPSATTKSYACDQRTAACAISFGGGSGPSATAWAIPGPTVVHVLVVGYVVNVTPVGLIPPEPPGVEIPLTVNVTPMGVIGLTADVTGGDPTVGGSTISYGEWWRYVAPGSSNVTGAVVCSLDGVAVAIITNSGIVPDTCVPNVLTAMGVSSTLLGPPLRDWVGIGSFRGVSPMFENMTWVNLTPDRLTSLGDLNFTPGAYITGEVYVQGTTTAPALFNVQACSTDEQESCGPAEQYSGSTNHSSENTSLPGCHLGPASFCVPAPPGPVVLTVYGSVTGFANQTWAYVPFRCCTASPHALTLWNVTDPHVESVNLTTALGTLTGKVVGGRGPVAPPLGYVEVESCLVSATASPPCTETATSNGTFTLTAPLGWNEITAIASSYEPNSTWVDLTGQNTTGTIVLTPHAVIAGRVTSPNGTGVLGASIEYCPIAPALRSQPSCAPLDSSGTGSGGLYSGEVVGGGFPAATYEILATASGYSGNWTWVNATPGALVIAPTIVLVPVGNASLPSPISAIPNAANGTQSTWVDGTLRDAATTLAVVGASLQACTFGTPPSCVLFSDSTSTGGVFNASLGLGAYELNVSEPGYVPQTVYINATGTAPVHIGTVDLTPYPWVSGRVAIAPWVSLTTSAGLGPGQAGVVLCNDRGTICAQTGILSTAGFFNVTAPVGLFDGLWLNATGGSPNDGFTRASAQGGGPGGFVSLVLPVNVSQTGATVGLPASSPPALEIFSSLTGRLYDGSTYDPAYHRPGAPARFSTLVVTGPRSGSNLSLYVSGGGQFALFVPGNESVRLLASGSAYLVVNATSVSVPASPGSSVVAPFELPHYGWVRARIATITGVPVPFATVGASAPDPANGTTISTGGLTDGHGYINLSAPPGPAVTVRASASGFGSSSAVAAVFPSQTSNLTLPGLPKAVTEFVVRSSSVNTLLGPPRVTVRDNATGLPVEAVAVAVTDAAGAVVDSGTVTNGLGQFLLAVSVEPSETLGFVRNGYLTNYSFVATPTPPVIVVDVENLTGYGVVAGRVVGVPSGEVVPGANITACPATGAQVCSTVETNGAGEFWIARPPGGYILSLSAPLYDTNVTLGAQVCQDCFTWLGDVHVWADAFVSGIVVGEPLDFPVAGSNVTLCPTNGSFFLACLFPTPTDSQGGFRIVAPQGSYAFAATAPSYGPVDLPVQLSVGEQLDMGLIALPADGVISGAVLSANNSSAIADAALFACPTGPGACSPIAYSDVLGDYRLTNVTPGDEELTVTALGFLPGYVPLYVPPGGIVLAHPIYLWPLNVTPHYPFDGVVLWNATGLPVVGALVRASLVGGGVVASARTGSNGTFFFVLDAGSYDVLVSAPGARPTGFPTSIASAPVTNVTVRLDPMTYSVHGIVTGSGPGVPLAGIRVSAGSTASTLSASDGSYALDLPNGTFRLVAAPVGGAQAAEFGSASSALKVAGQGAVVNLALPERTEPVRVSAVDTESGLGVPGAPGAVAGRDEFGAVHSALLTTASNGSANASLPPGEYTLWLNASGYLPAEQAFQVTGAGASLVVGLAPILSSSASPGLGPMVLTVAAIEAGAIVLAVGAFWAIRRYRYRRPPEPPGAPAEESAPEVATPGAWAGAPGPKAPP